VTQCRRVILGVRRCMEHVWRRLRRLARLAQRSLVAARRLTASRWQWTPRQECTAVGQPDHRRLRRRTREVCPANRSSAARWRPSRWALGARGVPQGTRIWQSGRRAPGLGGDTRRTAPIPATMAPSPRPDRGSRGPRKPRPARKRRRMRLRTVLGFSRVRPHSWACAEFPRPG